jgi:hypothetical protein
MRWLAPLVAWLQLKGAEVHWPSKFDVEAQGARGAGLVARTALRRGELLLALPPDALVRSDDRFDLAEWLLRERLARVAPTPAKCSHGGGGGGDDDDDDACAAATLPGEQQQRRRQKEEQQQQDESYFEDESEQGAPEDWSAYIDSLPLAYESSRLPSGNAYLRARAALAPDGAALDERLAGRLLDSDTAARARHALDAAPPFVRDRGLANEWLLALALVTSRMHRVWAVDAYGDWVQVNALVPLADLLNAATNGLEPSIKCETRVEDANFICILTRDVEAGEELLVPYGDGKATREELENTYGPFDRGLGSPV